METGGKGNRMHTQRKQVMAVVGGGVILLSVTIIVIVVMTEDEGSSGGEGGTGITEPAALREHVYESTCARATNSTKNQTWLVTVLTSGTNTLCGGSLLAPDIVVTSASCIPKNLVNGNGLVADGSSIQARDGQKPAIKVLSAIVHAAYNAGLQYPWHDIALLKLTAPLGSLQPVCLPGSEEAIPAKCVFLSQGLKDPAQASSLPATPQRLDLFLYGRQKCLTFKPFEKKLGPFLDESVLCSHSDKRQRDICYGDVGAPVMCRGEAGGELQQFGIVAMMPAQSPCGVLPDQVNTVTSLPFYRAWLLNVAQAALLDVKKTDGTLSCAKKHCVAKLPKDDFHASTRDYVCRVFAAYVFCLANGSSEEKRSCNRSVLPRYLKRGPSFEPKLFSRTKLTEYFEDWRSTVKC